MNRDSRNTNSWRRHLLFVAILLAFTPKPANGFAYLFAGVTNGFDVVTHAIGYDGTGGLLQISVGIDPTSQFASQMLPSVQNAVATWNALIPTTGNLRIGTDNDVPANAVDFESTLLHEIGHALGLNHTNAGTESGLPAASRDYAKAERGPNNTFDLNPGPDGIPGSRDDARGDDINLNYFRTANNHPFSIDATVDATTYTRDTSLLPLADSFSENPDRFVAFFTRGLANTEAVMNQGTFLDEAQRSLAHDDVAGIRYGMSGLDELAGTADDYTLQLLFGGLTDAADIVIDFDNSAAAFALTETPHVDLGNGHFAIEQANVFFNNGFNWHFTAASVPEPAGCFLVSTLAALTSIFRYRRR